MKEIMDELKLKNGRTLKVVFQFAEGLSKEESQRRRNEVYDALLKAMKKRQDREPNHA